MLRYTGLLQGNQTPGQVTAWTSTSIWILIDLDILDHLSSYNLQRIFRKIQDFLIVQKIWSESMNNFRSNILMNMLPQNHIKNFGSTIFINSLLGRYALEG